MFQIGIDFQALMLILLFGPSLANKQDGSLSMMYCKSQVLETLKDRNILKNDVWQCCNILLVNPHMAN